MTQQIKSRLAEIEAEQGFRILYANESGSRAWGFASADSDYDVRFIYVWPRDRYLSVIAPPETLDLGVDENLLDISGWDLRKALRLFRKSNGSVVEWLGSPIVYREEPGFVARWRNLTGDVFSPKSSAAHYAGLGKNMWSSLCSEEAPTSKRYLYALRAVLSAGFVLDHKRPAPVRFAELLDQVDVEATLREEIDAMVAEKAGGSEGDTLPRRGAIDAFIGTSLERSLERLDALETQLPPTGPLDALFRSAFDLP